MLTLCSPNLRIPLNPPAASPWLNQGSLLVPILFPFQPLSLQRGSCCQLETHARATEPGSSLSTEASLSTCGPHSDQLSEVLGIPLRKDKEPSPIFHPGQPDSAVLSAGVGPLLAGNTENLENMAIHRPDSTQKTGAQTLSREEDF